MSGAERHARRSLLGLPLAAVTFIGLVMVAAMPLAAHAQAIDLAAFPALTLDQLSAKHRAWLEREVMWIIIDTEREIFMRLPSGAQRDEFIRQFWIHRDPTPGTERNEFRELHDQRLVYADRQYGRETGRAGRLTDRGRVEVLFGAPRAVDRFPGSPVTVPLEVWSYAVDPVLGVPPFFSLVFFRERGIGEHRLYSPLADGPERLLNPAGQSEAANRSAQSIRGRTTRATGFGDLASVLDVLRTVDLVLADVSLSLIPGDPATIAMSPLRSEELLTRMAGVPDRMMPDPTWASRLLVGTVDAAVRFETLPVQVIAAPLMDPAGVPYLHYAIHIPGNRINFGEYEERYYATYELTVAVRDDQLRFPVVPETRTVELVLSAANTRELRSRGLVHLGRLPIPSGRFHLDVTVENNVTHQFGRSEVVVRSESSHPAAVTSTDPILVRGYDDLGDDYDPYGGHFPFQIGPYLMMPAFDGTVATDTTVWVFHQLLAPVSATGPAIASYTLVDRSGIVVVTKESSLNLAAKDEFGVLSQLAGLDLTGVAPGEYTLQVDIDIDDRPPYPLPVRVVTAEDLVVPVPHAGQQPPANDSDELLTRALQLRTLGRTDEAIEQLRTVLARDPDHRIAVQLQIELLSDAGHLDDLATLLGAHVIDEPDDIDALLALAEVEARRSNSYDAIRFYERARLGGAPDTPQLLNRLASVYLAEGNEGQARELLELSLRLNAKQPTIAALLRRLREDKS